MTDGSYEAASDGAPDPRHVPGRHLVLVGPTASGKSAVAMELARRRIAAGIPTEILSCDSMQVYRGMDIGTAKPTPAERAEVPHHLIDLVDPSEDHNLPRFLDAARRALSGIGARGSTALLVGGTGLYVRALVDDFDPPPHFPGITSELEQTGDTSVLAARLAELDPVALSRIPPGNRRRIIRALEVTIGTGTAFSEHGATLEHHPPTPFVLCGLRPDRDHLTEAINMRYESQMATGFLEEARALSLAQPPMSRTARQALGYRELFGYLAGGTTLDDAVSTAKVRTRRFAVRQLRWFGRDPRIEWFEPPGVGRSPTQVAAEVDLHWRKRAAGRLRSTTSVAPTAPTGSPGERAATHKEQPTLMRLGKYHGLGNDFLVALGARNPGLAPDPETARMLCDRKRGVGADGLIYGLEATGTGNDAMMVLLNSDGSRPEISGNGIRCLAQALLRDGSHGPGRGRVTGVLRIETDAGLREVRPAGGDPDRCVTLTVDMGTVADGPVPTGETLRWGARNVSTVDIGNPHLVLEVDDPTAVDLAVEGPALENQYGDGINVHFVSAPDEGHLLLRVWERGVGVTEACGSGAAAAVAAANGWGLIDAVGTPVEVLMPGGTAGVEVHGDRVYLTGPSEFVAEVITP